MRRTLALLLFILALLTLVGCGPTPDPIIITATPEPTLTFDPTPTREVWTETPAPQPTIGIDNPHAQFPTFSIINVNPYLSGQPDEYCMDGDGLLDGWVCEQGDGRIVALPPQWDLVNHMGSVNLPPLVFPKANGYQFEISWINGSFGLGGGVTLYPNQRYIVKTVFTLDMRYQDGIPAPVSVGATIYNTDGGTKTVLAPISPSSLYGRHEALWVIETQRTNPTIKLEVYVILPWPQLVGHITFESITVETAPVGYGGDAVIEF
jgi:hypothetical protein